MTTEQPPDDLKGKLQYTIKIEIYENAVLNLVEETEKGTVKFDRIVSALEYFKYDIIANYIHKNQ